MDFITDLPLSIKSGAKILLKIADRLSKGVILILILLISTPAVTTAFIKHYIPYHGYLKAIINDKSTQFINAVWATIDETLEIKCCLF